MRNILLTAALSCSVCAALLAESPTSDYTLLRYDTTDGGILWNLSDNGLWGIVRVGSVSAGGYATPKLYDVEAGAAEEVRYQGRLIDIHDVSDDGAVVVGSLDNEPVAYNRITDQLTRFAMRPQWQWGSLHSVTPDGKWAVGEYNGYTGTFGSVEVGDDEIQLTGDYYFSPLMVNIETGDTLALPGLPRLDMANLDQHAMTFNAITPDGRYAIGQMDWYIMQPVSGFTFIYDAHEGTYRVIGFDENDHGPWQPHIPYLHHIEGAVMSPNGRYLAGMAYMALPQAGSEFFNEYGCPFRYDMQTDELRVYDEGDSHNISVGAVTDEGTIFGNPDTGSPLRNFRVLYRDRYWISFSQICQQAYGFNFQERTGYDYTGTVVGISGNGQRFAAFPDPTSQSYIFDFGRPVDEVCAGIDLLSNYSVSPEPGTEFALISNVEINFGRQVQILGSGANVRLYHEDGTLAYTGLNSGGLTLKTGSKTTVVAAFRTRPLEAGEHYTLVIDAGAVALLDDADIANREIRIDYVGRSNGPVQLTKSTPADHSQLRQIDNTSAYILFDFDARIHVTDQALAYLERVEDDSRVATFAVAAGNTEATSRQLLLLPPSTLYLYAGEDYRLVLCEGSVTDRSGAATSANERISLIYHGTYVREAGNEVVLFADDFNQPATSLITWLQFEGDHRRPSQTMQDWGFDADNTPWNYSLRDSEESTDYFAGSHSMYQTAATSDDWMITPQIAVPLDGQALLEFDAQSYKARKSDYLALYVYENRRVLSYLNSSIMDDIRQHATLLDSVRLTPGALSEVTAGEWTHYSYSLERWAGKDIYIAFANLNRDQSAIFVDNVSVQRQLNFLLGFSNRERVVAQSDITIAGQFTVLCDETTGGASLILRDADGQQVSRCTWDKVPALGQPVAFSFPQPLPLVMGSEVPYTIDVLIGEKADLYQGSIFNLAFEPVKRVVLEEMTGNTCVNCPLGIVSVEQCLRAFGDRFIPIGIHSYTGDNLGSYFADYTEFLGLPGAPLARINRLPEIYAPMARLGDEYYYRDVAGETLWYDVVASELSTLTIADLSIEARLNDDGQQFIFMPRLRYAIDADNQQLAILVVVTEDGIVSFQQNAFSSMESSTMADWCQDGPYAEYVAYPYVHNHVARAVVGQTYGGTIGAFPTSLLSSESYMTRFTAACPSSIIDNKRLTAVAMLIDTQTGQVINAAQTHVVTDDDEDAIHDITADADQAAVLCSLSGTVIRPAATTDDLQQLPAGVYILGRSKVIIR